MLDPFIEGLKIRELLLQYDSAARKFQFRPRPMSIHSETGELEWRPADGGGNVVSHTRIPAASDPATERLIAVVELDEGVRTFAPPVETETYQVRCGLTVEIVWHDGDDNIGPFALRPRKA